VLIVFEGVARAGKSTLINGLRNKLLAQGNQVVVTEWNSYEATQKIINEKKTNFTLRPFSYSTLHLADFALRYEEEILPALNQDKIVIADRWYYTAIVRDLARGLSPDFVRNCYQFARKPDLVFYITIPVELSIKRHQETKKYYGYNAGLDIWKNEDVHLVYYRYHRLLDALYRYLPEFHSFIELDGQREIEEILEQVVESIPMLSLK
jgi:dTMP kinase